MTEPKSAKELANYEPFMCDKPEQLPPPPCNLPKKCPLAFKHPETGVSGTRYLTFIF